MSARANYEAWLNSEIIDEATKEELRSISDNSDEIEERFYMDLEFGTGGLRGVMGAGTNRMNIYTVRKATQGLANYIKKNNEFSDCSVVISYDNRHNSKEYAIETAGCLVANGIKTYIFDSLRPTPVLSFAVRYLECTAGVNITASHNPKEYNGYKVYGPDGSQVVSPMDKAIMNEVRAIQTLEECASLSEEELLSNPLYKVLDEDVDEAYYDAIKDISIRPGVIKQNPDISIVYSPLHGTGLVPVTKVLKENGLENVHIVEEQAVQNGDFATVKSPNPENEKAFECALKLAEKVKSDLVLLTDPDADRLGLCALDKMSGEYKHFTGNMMGALLCEYVLSSRTELGTMPNNPSIVSTVVITDLVRKICDSYGVYCDANNLIGFKYIANKIREYEGNSSYEYVFGLEDSDGCLPGTYARDKDAVGTVLLLCEAAAYYHSIGLTLWEQMLNIYEKYGYFAEDLKTKKIPGVDGQEKIANMIATLRENPLDMIGESKVVSVSDYKTGIYFDAVTGESREAKLDKSNMIYYRLENDGWFLVRPSGTEPKIKFYMGAKGNSLEDSKTKIEALINAVMKIFE
ncbi:MAG: phospho-sugar mutase [Lachnospiraceae bacterium]|nr:phospho-sugar mutase [Lachnospiraceae bacterium]